MYPDLRGPIRDVLIVGGGTAGWLSAAYLQQAMGPRTRITVIEASDIPTVGVGEATLPTLQGTLAFLGLSERDWMPRCEATYKAAIRFVNWVDPPQPGAPDHHFDHPFGDRPEEQVQPYARPHFPAHGAGISLFHYWLVQHRQGRTTQPLSYACHPTSALCDASRAPRTVESDQHLIRSAYHLDAGRLADLLREVAKGRGVRHRIARVEGADLDARGYICAVRLRGGGTLSADLYIDCSGMRGLLINGALGQRFVKDDASLKCDAAVAIRVPADPDVHGLPPYTTATAIDHGWVWNVPLLNRRGTGYVYGRAHRTREQAENELRAHLRSLYGDAADRSDAAHLSMRVGHNPEPWLRNCIAIGLASCFLEPLESTGIFLIEYQLACLVPLLPTLGMEEPLRRRYNAVMAATYAELRDFIVLHYVLSQRRDTTFWRDVADNTALPETLADKLAAFDVSFPVLDMLHFTVFKATSYASILAGMRRYPRQVYPLLQYADATRGDAAFEAVRQRTTELLHKLPDHLACVRALHGLDDFEKTRGQ